MKAIEFIARARDGLIEIPPQYLKNLEEFRVIILVNHEQPESKLTAKK
jgi:hypothetical protein